MLRVSVVLLLCCGIAAADPTPSEEDAVLYSCHQKSGEVAVTFKPETELKDLVTWVMGFSCKNFIFDPRIVATGKKVTIIAPNKLASKEAYGVFLVALKTIGLTVVRKGDVMVIVDASAAKKETVPIVKKGGVDGTDQMVRIVVKPAFATAEALGKAFTALKSDAGDIQTINSVLLITDYASHVRDMQSIASLIDVPNGTDGIYTIPVIHADAAKLNEKLAQILGVANTAPGAKPGDPPSAPTPTKLLVDDRTNTLIVAASEAAYQRVKALVERLDIQLDIEGGQSIHVYQCQNAIAEELATVINTAITGQAAKPTQPAAANNTTATAQKQQAQVTGPTTVDNLGTMLEGQVRVIADKATNKVIVMSSGRDFVAVKGVIRELDEPRRQVFIEAAILEVAINDNTSLGTSSHAATTAADGTALVLGGVQTGVSTLGLSNSSSSSSDSTSSSASQLASLTGLITGVIGSSVSSSTSILGVSIPSYAVLFQALATNSDTNVVSNPSIVALDNEQANYQVGIDIPYQAGTTLAATGLAQSTYAREPLVLELNIKPHISANDSVLLEIKHTAKDLQGTTAAGPIWSTRAIETRVLVRDQDTIVLGGLTQTREDIVTTKVPLLGDIPLLGYLFKYKSTTKKKTNLLIMLTPYIIKDTLDLANIRMRKQREHDEFASSFSSLNGMHYDPAIDYGKKRGLIEEINLMVKSVEDDRALLRDVPPPRHVESGAVR